MYEDICLIFEIGERRNLNLYNYRNNYHNFDFSK